MKRLSAVLAGLFLTVACAAPAPAPPSTRTVEIPDLVPRLEQLTATLEEERVATHVVGMAIAIVKDDEVVLAKGFGFADLESERPATSETLFAIGSSTKAFTSTTIGMLMDEGKMSWDDPVTRYLPYFELPVDVEGFDGDPVVTIRDLLCHRTGFTRMGVLWAAGRTDRKTILATATKAEPWSPFRKAFFYNNVMFLAAGEAAAVAAGSDWDALVKERLLVPLGMNDANTSVPLSQKDPRLALGYAWDAEKKEFEHQPMRVLDAVAPAGAINANVLDMAQWLRLQLGRGVFEGRRLVDAARIEDTWTPQIEIAPGLRYGLGWMLGEWNGQRVVEHGGNIDGFSATVAMLPDAGIGFVLLTNASSTALQQSSLRTVWEALLGERTPPADVGEAEVAAIDAESLEDYLGIYIADYAQFEGEHFEVLLQDGHLALDIPSQMTFELLAPDEEGKRPFAIAPDTIQASFVRDDAGKVVILKLYQAGMTFEVPREGITLPPDGTEEEFAKYYGTYEHSQLPEPIRVVYARGRLACDIPNQMVFGLRRPGPDGVWHFQATDELGLQFHADEAGKVVSLTFHERGTETVCPRLGEGMVELPTIEEVLALRHAVAVSEKLDALGAMRFTGTIRFVHAGISGTNVVTVSGHDRFLSESSFEPFGWMTTGFDGEKGWSESAFSPFEEVEGTLLEQLRLSHPAVFFGDWNRYFDSAQVVRASADGDRQRWVVRLKKGDLPAWSAYVDAETGDIVRVDSKTVIPGVGSLAQKAILEDYREVHGMRLPHRQITETVENGRVIVQVESVEAGIAVPAAFFSPKK